MLHSTADFVLRVVAIDQPERHVLVDRHVRIQCVILEHHRDIAVLGLQLVDDEAIDRDRARGDVFEARDHPKQGRLPAAGRTDEHEEFIVADLEVQRMQYLERTKRLGHLDERQGRHQLFSGANACANVVTMRNQTKEIRERRTFLLLDYAAADRFATDGRLKKRKSRFAVASITSLRFAGLRCMQRSSSAIISLSSNRSMEIEGDRKFRKSPNAATALTCTP